MDYVRVASVADVGMGQILPIEAKGEKMLLTQVGATFHVAARKCPHLGFNLCRGSLEGASVVCPLHKAKFDLATGEIERDPKLLFLNLKAKSKLKVYPVRVLDNDIFVGI
jgi:nitrite reductase/ring-hydroxylating ferredoxin subunit